MAPRPKPPPKPPGPRFDLARIETWRELETRLTEAVASDPADPRKTFRVLVQLRELVRGEIQAMVKT